MLVNMERVVPNRQVAQIRRNRQTVMAVLQVDRADGGPIPSLEILLIVTVASPANTGPAKRTATHTVAII